MWNFNINSFDMKPIHIMKILCNSRVALLLEIDSSVSHYVQKYIMNLLQFYKLHMSLNTGKSKISSERIYIGLIAHIAIFPIPRNFSLSDSYVM